MTGYDKEDVIPTPKVLQGMTKEGGMTEIIVSIEKAAKLKLICDTFLVKPSGKYLMSLCWYGGLRLDQIAKQLCG